MPSSPNYVRDYKQEEKTAKARGDYKRRAERNKARKIMEEEDLVHKGDGKDVDHKQPLTKGGKTTRSNLRVQDDSDNRSYARTKSGAIKGKK
jgi:hypothetical protein